MAKEDDDKIGVDGTQRTDNLASLFNPKVLPGVISYIPGIVGGPIENTAGVANESPQPGKKPFF